MSDEKIVEMETRRQLNDGKPNSTVLSVLPSQQQNKKAAEMSGTVLEHISKESTVYFKMQLQVVCLEMTSYSHSKVATPQNV